MLELTKYLFISAHSACCDLLCCIMICVFPICTALQRGHQRKPRISFSPVTLINSSPSGNAARAKSSERRVAGLSPTGDRSSRSSTRSTAANKSRAMVSGGNFCSQQHALLPACIGDGFGYAPGLWDSLIVGPLGWFSPIYCFY